MYYSIYKYSKLPALSTVFLSVSQPWLAFSFSLACSGFLPLICIKFSISQLFDALTLPIPQFPVHGEWTGNEFWHWDATKLCRQVDLHESLWFMLLHDIVSILFVQHFSKCTLLQVRLIKYITKWHMTSYSLMHNLNKEEDTTAGLQCCSRVPQVSR